MKEKQTFQKNYDFKTSNIFTSQNDLMSENNLYKNDGKKVYESIKERNKEAKKGEEHKNRSKRKINMLSAKEDINSLSSKRSNENILLLKKNKSNNYINKYNLEKKKNFDIETIDSYFHKKDNKISIEEINNNETLNDIEKENENKISEINDEGIDINEIFNKITGYDIFQGIKFNYVKLFFFNSLPKDKTLNTNINKIKKENNNNLDFNYNLEILRNNKIYFYAKVKKTFPSLNIKLFIQESESDYLKVGKITSNVLKNNFIVYKGDSKENYQKILNVNYEFNFFGTKVRKMTVEKIVNNNVVYVLCNDSPQWDLEYKTYKLDFNGRVKQSCKKNFILRYKDCNENKDEDGNINQDKILQCGKIDDFCFALDFISPLSPFEAFSISISSIVYKLSCE
jgi:hypothetical protein